MDVLFTADASPWAPDGATVARVHAMLGEVHRCAPGPPKLEFLLMSIMPENKNTRASAVTRIEFVHAHLRSALQNGRTRTSASLPKSTWCKLQSCHTPAATLLPLPVPASGQCPGYGRDQRVWREALRRAGRLH